MIEETDRLRLWEKNVGGFTFKDRDEFLQRKVLIDYDLTEKQTKRIVEALKAGDERSARRILGDAPELKPTGRPKKGEESSPLQKGANTTRLAARIKRDHPEIAARTEPGTAVAQTCINLATNLQESRITSAAHSPPIRPQQQRQRQKAVGKERSSAAIAQPRAASVATGRN